MSDEISQAVAFADSYFALADGLVPDFEQYLAEDVVLDWFGQTVKGRTNVAVFIKSQTPHSMHIINEICPTSSVEYGKQRPFRRKYHSLGANCKGSNLFNLADENEECDDIQYKRRCYSDGFGPDSNQNHPITDSPEGTRLMDLDDNNTSLDNKRPHPLSSSSFCYQQPTTTFYERVPDLDLNLDTLQINSAQTPILESPKGTDLYSDKVDDALLDLSQELQMNMEVKKTDVNEIEEKIMRLREKNLDSIANSSVNETEIGQGDPPLPAELKPIKYVEACGVIELARFSNVKQIRKDIRKRQCRLQIAYSVKDKNLKTEMLETMEISISEPEHAQDVCDSVGDLINNNTHSSSTNKNKDVNVNYLFTPKIPTKQKKIVVNKGRPKSLRNSFDSNNFVFNYEIHLIIYESNTKCRLNLSHEFESKEFTDDD